MWGISTPRDSQGVMGAISAQRDPQDGGMTGGVSTSLNLWDVTGEGLNPLPPHSSRRDETGESQHPNLPPATARGFSPSHTPTRRTTASTAASVCACGHALDGEGGGALTLTPPFSSLPPSLSTRRSRPGGGSGGPSRLGLQSPGGRAGTYTRRRGGAALLGPTDGERGSAARHARPPPAPLRRSLPPPPPHGRRSRAGPRPP